MVIAGSDDPNGLEIKDHFEDIPGIEKGGYGEWAYSGDDAVLEAIGQGDPDE